MKSDTEGDAQANGDEFVVSPISAGAVRAAQAIFDRMANAQQHDAILRKAQVAFPSTDFADTLSRVILLDALYATRLMARSRMATHIGTLGNLKQWSGEGCLVDAIAKLPPTKAKPTPDADSSDARVTNVKKDRTHKSFASKYAHIFVDSARYHILDEAAVRMIAWHTSSTLTAAKAWSYEDFNRRAEAVRKENSLAADRSLDRYLWVTGMRYRQRGGGAVNTELASVFDDRRSERDLELIDAVLPPFRKKRRKTKGSLPLDVE